MRLDHIYDDRKRSASVGVRGGQSCCGANCTVVQVLAVGIDFDLSDCKLLGATQVVC